MRYDEFIEILEEFNRCQLTELGKVVKELILEVEEADNQVNRDILRLGKAALNMREFIGDIDDFHNIAVTFAKIDFFDLACDYLEKGLEIFPYSVDLLADYIIYGLSCGNMEKCAKYYSELNEIPIERWTWRCFTFSVDFLLGRLTYELLDLEEIKEVKEEILTLSEKCQSFNPNEEYGYLMEAKTYREFNELEEEKKTLLRCIENVQVSPKCAMRLADTFYKVGDFDEALKYVNRCIKDDISTVAKINKGYPLYLQALCKISIYYRDFFDSIGGDSSIDDAIEDVYMSCRLAKKTLRDIDKLDNLQMLVDILEVKTGIACD